MTRTHTPGPWHTIPANTGEKATDILACPDGDPEGRLVCAVHDTADTEGEANARLICAAPALLAACESLVAAHDAYRADDAGVSDDVLDAIMAQIRAAVARAKGEA